jgi:hypothetical protein
MRRSLVGGLFHLWRVLVAMPDLLKAFSCTKINPGTSRPCEKDSSRQHIRFFYCAFTTSRGVFTQPASPGA